MVTLDSHSNILADQDRFFAVYPATNGAFYQSFKTPAGSSYKLTSISALLHKGASGTTCTVRIELYEHAGVYGASSTPGTLLASSNSVTQTAISTAYTMVPFTFPTEPVLHPDTAYVFVIKCLALGGTLEMLVLGVDAVAPSHAGNGGAWTSA